VVATTIVRNNKKEKEFVNKLRNRINDLDMTKILNYDMLE